MMATWVPRADAAASAAKTGRASLDRDRAGTPDRGCRYARRGRQCSGLAACGKHGFVTDWAPFSEERAAPTATCSSNGAVGEVAGFVRRTFITEAV